MPSVQIYIDGACRGNPGPGGWAALLRYGTQEKILAGGDPATTNNRMELMAAICALEALSRPCEVELYTDSNYLKRGVTEWLAGWKRRGWKRRDQLGNELPLANAELWQRLDAVRQKHTIRWHWVKGHAENADNLRVDGLARQAIPHT